MEQATCSRSGCHQKASARGLCNPCYQSAYRDGQVHLEPPKKRHLVSDVDREARTGVCVICGPVRIKYKPHRNYYECGTLTQRYKKNYKPKPATPATRRRLRLKSRYGLTIDQYDQMYEAAGGSCEICRDELPLLQVDHDHDSGEVRGLLCSPCNRGLGNFRDNPAFMEAALAYLARTKDATGAVA